LKTLFKTTFFRSRFKCRRAHATPLVWAGCFEIPQRRTGSVGGSLQGRSFQIIQPMLLSSHLPECGLVSGPVKPLRGAGAGPNDRATLASNAQNVPEKTRLKADCVQVTQS
jgi:hypothetical protein